MIKKLPQRLAIIGLPGSGKSTFASKLGSSLHLPVHHLDKHVFDGRNKRDKQDFLAIKEALVSEDSWIIEGCSLATLEMRVARADTVIYFHFSRLRCVWRLCKRLFSFDQDLVNSGCLRVINWPLLKYMWNFDRNNREKIEDLRRRYPDVQFLVFHCPDDLDRFLEKIKSLQEPNLMRT